MRTRGTLAGDRRERDGRTSEFSVPLPRSFSFSFHSRILGLRFRVGGWRERSRDLERVRSAFSGLGEQNREWPYRPQNLEGGRKKSWGFLLGTIKIQAHKVWKVSGLRTEALSIPPVLGCWGMYRIQFGCE
jgi:hypothetical protein